jgi:thiol-disulfide isomerase/thioredoxin
VQKLLQTAAAVVVMAWLAAAAHAGDAPEKAQPASLETQLRASMKVPADFHFAYHAIDGSTITREQFVAKAGKGAPFDVGRDDAHKTVTLKLLDMSPAGEIGAVTRLPDFNLEQLGGGRARSADLRGRITLINFFFETCVPCIKEAPMLSAFRRQHPEYNYLAVTNDAADAAARFVAQRKLDWPVAVDAGTLIAATQVKGFPTYLLVAADGRILGRGAGMDLEHPDQALARFEQWVKQRLSR